MRRPEPATLRGNLGGIAERFVADASGRWPMAALLQNAAAPDLQAFAGSNVLLAVPDQLTCITALLALDGVARRLLLWPAGALPDDADGLRRAGAVECVLRDWPPPAAASLPRACPTRATEWVLFTSGTTARPKLVLHTLRTLAGHLLAAPCPRSQPTWCSFYDVRRYGGLQVLLRALLSGGSLVLSHTGEAPAETLRRAAACGATHFLGTPSHWRRVLLTAEASMIRPEYVRLSGEIADQQLLDRLRATYPAARIVHAFASTEAGLVCEVTDGRAGLPASFLATGGGFAEIELDAGKLRARSARNALGYLDGAMQALRGSDGFVETGDVLEQHGDRLFFLGRNDGVINVGGEKIHPEEVEAVLQQDPAVQMCAVRSRANPITGAVVTADIVARAGAAPDLPERLRALCQKHLPAHKVPVTIRMVPQLAVADSGKLVRQLA